MKVMKKRGKKVKKEEPKKSRGLTSPKLKRYSKELGNLKKARDYLLSEMKRISGVRKGVMEKISKEKEILRLAKKIKIIREGKDDVDEVKVKKKRKKTGKKKK